MSAESSKWEILDSIDEDAALYVDDRGEWMRGPLERAIEAGWTKTDYTDATRQKAKEIREERKEKKRREAKKKAIEKTQKAPEGVPLFERGDNAEIALKLNQSIAEESGGEPPAYCRGELAAYDPETGTWEMVTDDLLSCEIQSWAGRALVGKEDPKPLRVNAVDTTIGLAKSLPVRWGRADGWLEGGAKGLGFLDVFVCSVTRGGKHVIEFRDPSPENRCTVGYGFELDTDNEAGRFCDYIESLFEGADDKEERILCLQEHVGASILGIGPDFQKALILYGPPGTGKSTLLEILSDVFPQPVSAIQPKEWDEPQMLAKLADSRLNLVNEMSYQDLSDANMVKRVITGDLVTGKKVYREPFEFHPECGHIITANTDQLPSVPNADNAFWDRWHCVPMERRFRGEEAQDRTIASSMLEEERQQIVSWCVRGAIRLCEQQGYTEVDSGQVVIDDWKGSASSVATFFDECTTQVVDLEAKRDLELMADVFDFYLQWCDVNGYRTPVAKRTFFSRSGGLGLKVRANGVRCRARVTSKAREEVHRRANGTTMF